MDFDASLGFPGKGPVLRQLFVLLSLMTSPRLGWGAGTSHGDLLRQKQREGIELPEGRRVTELTTSVRGHPASAFNAWLRREGMSFEEVFMSTPPDLDRVNKVLTQYGRHLFACGKPYYHLSETINLVSAY